MSALMHTAPLTSLRDFAAPLQEQPSSICRRRLHRRPVSAQHVAPFCHAYTKSSRRDVRASARAVAENPVAPEVKSGQKVSHLNRCKCFCVRICHRYMDTKGCERCHCGYRQSACMLCRQIGMQLWRAQNSCYMMFKMRPLQSS